MTSQVKNTKSGNIFEPLQSWFDGFQQRHKSVGFPYAVIKKYSDDEAGYQAALITYYGFLSLFPLLIVATAVIQTVSQKNFSLRDQFIQSVNSYFPAIGSSLTESINTPSKSGLTLFAGLLIMFYGARGITQAIQHALNHLWAVPRHKRTGFPKAPLRSLAMIVFGGIGLVIAASFNGWAASAGHDIASRFVLWLSGFTVLFLVLWGIFTFGSSARKRPFSNIPGAFLAALGLLTLQVMGSYLITRQLHSFKGLNAQFAIVLVLMFWMYLQAQLVMYAIEFNSVRTLKLWPRSVNNKPPTAADRKAYELYRDRETFHVDEPVGH
ncbi:MAG: YihY/virulence factor BrkB family protein [Candidatus Saccharimonadales bacterium]